MGLLTYSDSRYKHNPTHDLFHFPERFQIEAQFNTFISESDEFDEINKPLLRIFSSEIALLQLKLAWLLYLERRTTLRLQLLNLFHFGFRLVKLLKKENREKKIREIRRLMNITSSYCRLIEQGIKNDADFILLIEDDAFLNENCEWNAVFSLCQELATGVNNLNYVDLSESYSFEQLGVEKLVLSEQVSQRFGHRVVTMRKPVTNTACAAMLEISFASDLMNFLQETRNSSFLSGIPHDWLINKYLIKHLDELSSSTWVHIKPGVFRQGSLKSTFDTD